MAAPWESDPVVEAPRAPAAGGLRRGAPAAPWESDAPTPTVESALPNVAAGGLTPPGRRGAAAVPTAQEAAGGGYAAPQPQAPREPSAREKVVGYVEAGIEMLAQITGGSAGVVTGGLAGIARSIGEGSFGTAGGTAAAAESAAAGGQAGAQMARQGIRMSPILGPAVAAVERSGGGLGPAMSPAGQESVEQVGGIINQLPAFQPAIGPAGGAAAALSQPGGLRRSVGMITDAVRRTPIEEPAPPAAGARGGGPRGPSGRYTIADAISADGPMEESVKLVVREDGTAAIQRDNGDVIDVTNMIRAGYSPERAIAQSLGDDTSGTNVSRTAATAPSAAPNRGVTAPAGSVGAAGADAGKMRRERAAGLPRPVPMTKGDVTRETGQQQLERDIAKDAESGRDVRSFRAEQDARVAENFDILETQTGAEKATAEGAGGAVVDVLEARKERLLGEIRTEYQKARRRGETAAQVPTDDIVQLLNESRSSERNAGVIGTAADELVRLGGAVRNKDGSLLPNAIDINSLEEIRKTVGVGGKKDATNSLFASRIRERIDSVLDAADGDTYKGARKRYADYAKEFTNQGVLRDLLANKKGTIDRTVAMERVFRRIVGEAAPVQDLRNLKRTLQAEGDAGRRAWGELQGEAIRQLREATFRTRAKNERGMKLASDAGLNNALKQLDRNGKLDELFGKQGAQTLRDLGEVVADIYTPTIDVTNPSGTGAYVKRMLIDLATSFGTGVPAPFATISKFVSDWRQGRKTKRAVAEALRQPDAKALDRRADTGARPFDLPPGDQGGPPPTPPSPKKPPPVERIPVGEATELPPASGRAPEMPALPVGKTREIAFSASRETKRERELLTLRDQVTDPEIRKDIDGEIAAERQRATDAARAAEYRQIAAATGDAELKAKFTAKAEKLAPTTKPSDVTPKVDTPTGAPPSWREFVADRMGPYMKSEGGHAGAMRRISEEWKAAKRGESEPIPVGEATEIEVQDATLDMVKATAQAEADWRREHRLGDMDAERAKTTAQALQYDAAAVERAAQQFENSPRAFDREVQRIIDEGEARANQGEQGAGGGQRLGRPAEAAGDAAGARPEPTRPDRAAAAGAQRAQPAGEGGPTARRLREAEAEFDKNTEPTGNPITDRFSQKLRADYDAAVAEYAARPDAKGGLVLNTDTARELSADYLKDRTKSADVHEPSSAFIKRVYAQRLHAPTPEGKERVVFFSAGGTGAGKSTGIAKLGDDLGSPEIVYDTNMNKAASAIQKIDQALEAGRDVRIMYVYADPIDAFYQAMSRAMNMAKREGSGRTVPIKEHINTHVGARKVIDQLQERYKDDLRVDFYGVNNSLGKGNAQQAAIADLPQVSENGLREILERTLNEAHQRGEITDAIRAGFLAEASPAVRDKGLERRVPAPVQRGSEEGSQPGASAQGLTPAAADLGATGAQTSVVTERGLRVPVQYRLADIGALITSHDDSLKENPAFDQRIQPRDRSRMGSEAQITRMQNALQPELLAESPKASDGAPIVGPDGIVESGTARTIALRRAYGTGKADAYRAFLEENAERFGLKPEDVRAMQRPVLVRQRTVEVDRADFARQANESPVSAMSDTEQARSDAQRLPDLEGLVTADDGQLNLGGSAEFIRQFMRYVVSPSEQNQLMTADGRLNQRGAARIRNAIFSRAYNDVDTVAMMTESTDANVRNVLAGMLRAAPEVAHLRDLMDAGARSGRDFAPDLVEAVRRFSDAREQGMKVEQALAQGSLIGGEARPEVAALMRALEADSRAPKRIAEMIRGLVQEIDSGGDPRQASLLGD